MYYVKKFILSTFLVLTTLLLIFISIFCGFLWNKSVRNFILEKQKDFSGYHVEIANLIVNRDIIAIEYFKVSEKSHEIITGSELSISPQYLTLFSKAPTLNSVVIKNVNVDLKLSGESEKNPKGSEASDRAFKLKQLEISNSNIKVLFPKQFDLKVKIATLSASEVTELGIDKVDLSAEVDYQVVEEKPSNEQKKEKFADTEPSFTIKLLNINKSSVKFNNLKKNQITLKIGELSGRELSSMGATSLKFLGDIEFLKFSKDNAVKLAVIDDLEFNSQIKVSKDVITISSLNLSFPTQDVYLNDREHKQANFKVLGDFKIGEINSGDIKNLTYNKDEDNILNLSGNFKLAKKIQNISISLAKFSSVFVEEFIELPAQLKQFDANGAFQVDLKNYQLHQATGKGLLNNIKLDSKLNNFPDLDYLLEISSDGVKYEFKNFAVNFLNSEKQLGNLNLTGNFNSSDKSVDLVSSVAVEDLKKIIYFLKGVSIAQNKALDAEIKLKGTAEKLTLDLTKLNYAQGTLKGNLVKDGDDFDILVSGKNLLAKDLYELSILEPSDDMTGVIEHVFGEVKYSKKYPLGVAGNFKLKGEDFNFSNRLQDIFPFNLLFLPFKVLGTTLSAFPKQLIPAELSSFSSATKGSIDNVQRLRANTVTINGSSDGNWVTLDKALFDMSGVTPSIEMPGKISKKQIEINSGIFLVGNKVPLPILGTPSLPLPDIVAFTKELAKTILNAPLNTIKSIGGMTGISSLFEGEKVEEKDDIDEIMKQREELLNEINDKGVADFVEGAVKEKTPDSDPAKVSIEKSLDEEDRGKEKTKIEKDEVKATLKPEMPALVD